MIVFREYETCMVTIGIGDCIGSYLEDTENVWAPLGGHIWKITTYYDSGSDLF